MSEQNGFVVEWEGGDGSKPTGLIKGRFSQLHQDHAEQFAQGYVNGFERHGMGLIGLRLRNEETGEVVWDEPELIIEVE